MSQTLASANAGNMIDRGAMSIDDFCRWGAISRAKFYREVEAGRISVRKVGRKSVVRMVDAHTWLDALPSADAVNGALGK